MPAQLKVYPTCEISEIYIHIEKFNSFELSGRLCTRYGVCEPFKGPLQMLVKTEKILDEFSVPQKMFADRHFYIPKMMKKEESPIMKPENSAAGHEDKATFIIRIKFRQNATWQGDIKWVDRGETQHFRSDLEMLKLMDEALKGSFPAEEDAKWENSKAIESNS